MSLNSPATPDLLRGDCPTCGGSGKITAVIGVTRTIDGAAISTIGKKPCAKCGGSARRWPKASGNGTPTSPDYAGVAPFDDGSIAVLTRPGMPWQAIRGLAGTPKIQPGDDCEAIRFARNKNAIRRPTNAVRRRQQRTLP